MFIVQRTVQRLVQHARLILRSLHIDNIHVVHAAAAESCPGSQHIGYLGTRARRILLNNVLNRVTDTFAANLRRRAATRLVFGQSTPFFALVGVSLASGILTKDDQLEGICYEIREAVSKFNTVPDTNPDQFTDSRQLSLRDFTIGPIIAKGCSAAVYAARFNDTTTVDDELSSLDDTIFPFAIKMMFNYDAESNAAAILRAMYRETVPVARSHYCENDQLANWPQQKWRVTLPPHPNIVTMYAVFADRVPLLPDSWTMYPDALPTAVNPTGSGRNMSLFLLMKRYDHTLRQYLSHIEHLDTRIPVMLLTQLLEAVAHMNANGIAHRDLKTDNILLDLSTDCPSLVVTDFGCCLADKVHKLYLPYNIPDVDKGGNVALMAPEVIQAQPGPFTTIDYTKADLWTVGTIAYEIFGMKNPFHGENNEKPALKNFSYNENQLPALPDNVPPIVSAVIKNILSTSLYERLCAELAATVMQLYLWAPSSWLVKHKKLLPSSNEIIQWLLCLTTKVLYQRRSIPSDDRYTQNIQVSSGIMPVDYQLIATFLTRVTLADVRNALRWIQQNT